jgi:hypothetical protein
MSECHTDPYPLNLFPGYISIMHINKIGSKCNITNKTKQKTHRALFRIAHLSPSVTCVVFMYLFDFFHFHQSHYPQHIQQK